jgi:hypothetical protein
VDLEKPERELENELELERVVARSIFCAIPRDELKVERLLELVEEWRDEFAPLSTEVVAIVQRFLDFGLEVQSEIDDAKGAVEGRI